MASIAALGDRNTTISKRRSRRNIAQATVRQCPWRPTFSISTRMTETVFGVLFHGSPRHAQAHQRAPIWRVGLASTRISRLPARQRHTVGQLPISSFSTSFGIPLSAHSARCGFEVPHHRHDGFNAKFEILETATADQHPVKPDSLRRGTMPTAVRDTGSACLANISDAAQRDHHLIEQIVGHARLGHALRVQKVRGRRLQDPVTSQHAVMGAGSVRCAVAASFENAESGPKTGVSSLPAALCLLSTARPSQWRYRSILRHCACV